MSIDPILDGTRYDLTEYVYEVVNFTAYLYVRDNPLRWVDPLGLIIADRGIPQIALYNDGGTTAGLDSAAQSTPTKAPAAQPSTSRTGGVISGDKAALGKVPQANITPIDPDPQPGPPKDAVVDPLRGKVKKYQVRDFVKSLGGTVKWNTKTESIEITLGNEAFSITPDEMYWMEDGQFWTTDTVIYSALGLERPTQWSDPFVGEIAGILFKKDLEQGIWYSPHTAKQRQFGYNDVYDMVFMVCDYTKFISEFTYRDKEGHQKEWRIEGWKGNYMNMGVGAEIGIYYREVMSPVVTSINSIKELILLVTGNYFAALVCAVIDTAVETHYGVVNDANMMIMSFSLYEGNADPRNLIFSRPEQLHWWLNGFRPDVDDIPAEKLTMKGSITFLLQYIYGQRHGSQPCLFPHCCQSC